MFSFVRKIGEHTFYYPDTLIFLISIPFIAAFNYYLTYSNIQLNGFLLLTFTIDTVQGFIAWGAVREIIFYLDRRLPYQPRLWTRILIQVIFTTIAGLTIIALTTELVSWIVKGKSAPLSFYTLDLVVISVWFLVINGVYIGIYFYRQWETIMRERKNLGIENTGLVVKKGKQSLLIKFEDISLFFVDTDYVHLLDRNGSQYLIDQSLYKVGNQLPASDFFRPNRQCIVHRQVIASFRRLENGKLMLQLHISSELPFDLIISRTKAPAFKNWFLPD